MIARLIIRNALSVIVMAGILFGAAGTLDWPAGWTFLALTWASGLTTGLWLARHDPQLLSERMAPLWQKGQERWDKIFIAAMPVLGIAWLAAMPLDAVRYRWSDVPQWLQWIGAILLLVGIYLAFLALRANSYAAAVVKIQSGHKVVTSGPYRYVRHPMYSGALLFLLGSALLLGSWLGVALAPALTAVLAARAVMEERMLSEKLDGYADYAARVRYRLIPWIW